MWMFLQLVTKYDVTVMRLVKTLHCDTNPSNAPLDFGEVGLFAVLPGQQGCVQGVARVALKGYVLERHQGLVTVLSPRHAVIILQVLNCC